MHEASFTTSARARPEPAGPPAVWLGIHLFLPPAEGDAKAAAGDRALGRLVLPAVRQALDEGWARRSFFIRYHELGSHLRLRFEGEPERLASYLRPALAERFGLEVEGVVDSAGERFASASGLVEHARWIDYEPELERYGGRAGVALAEDLFHASSRAVLELLRDGEPLEPGARSVQALFALATLVHAFAADREEAQALARRYGDEGVRLLRSQPGGPGTEAEWERLFARRAERQPAALADKVQAWWEAMEDGEELPSPWGRYHQDLIAAARRLRGLHAAGRLRFAQGGGASYADAVARLLPSYLHMTSNRIGISVLEEAFLGAYLAHRLAPRQGEPVAERECVAWSR